MQLLKTLLLSLALLASAATFAHEDKDAKLAMLMAKDLSDMPGKEALMLTVSYKPGEVEAPHRHDAHCFVYVLEGSVVMGVKGGKEQTLTAGQSFYEGPQDIHTVGRNASKTKPAKFLVLLIKDKQKPAVLPVE